MIEMVIGIGSTTNGDMGTLLVTFADDPVQMTKLR